MNKIVTAAVLTILLYGCGQVWNGADLQAWVVQRALEQGCNSETLLLDEWYTQESEKLIWYGQCTNDKTGEEVKLAIPVDSVWSPSKEQ